MRELTLEEIEAVSGAGFFGDLWGGISSFLQSAGDFLGFDGHFGYGGGGGGLSLGGFFGALGEGAGALWSLPNTAIGFLVGGAGYAFDHVFGDGSAQVSFGNGTITFTDDPFNVSATTLGHVVIVGEFYSDPRNNSLSSTLAHEGAHVTQGDQLGPFYLPSNLLGGLAGLVFDGGNWHGPANWNEVGPQLNPPTPW